MPVPIDQTGSYANTMLLKFLIPFNPIFICFFKTLYVFLFFLSCNFSPIQNTTFKFSLSADLIFLFIIKLVSSLLFLFSEWPKIIYFAPVDLINLAFIDPVKGPKSKFA